ncbi:MAG: hypothetical protein ABJC10_02060 [Acidobacteriota bacterium]
MKISKALCAATLFALLFTVPAYAEDPKPGDQHTPGSSTPCPDTSLTGGVSADEGDVGLLTLADLLWALASIY